MSFIKRFFGIEMKIDILFELLFRFLVGKNFTGNPEVCLPFITYRYTIVSGLLHAAPMELKILFGIMCYKHFAPNGAKILLLLKYSGSG